MIIDESSATDYNNITLLGEKLHCLQLYSNIARNIDKALGTDNSIVRLQELWPCSWILSMYMGAYENSMTDLYLQQFSDGTHWIDLADVLL